MPPQNFTAKLAEKIEYNPKFTHYFFELENPPRIEFNAGQYVSIAISDQGERRSYSICSSPGHKHSFELLIDNSPDGLGVKFLNNLQFGDTISFLAPMGQLVLDGNQSETSLVFVATGSGIAPFRSMVLDLLHEKHDGREITLLWGLRHIENMIWENDFQGMAESFPNFKFHPTLSRAPQEWPLCRGRVTDCLQVHQFSDQAGYYLCGGTAMIEDVNRLLLEKGISEQQIHFEKFF